MTVPFFLGTHRKAGDEAVVVSAAISTYPIPVTRGWKLASVLPPTRATEMMLVSSCCCRLCLHSDTDALASTWTSSLSPWSPATTPAALLCARAQGCCLELSRHANLSFAFIVHLLCSKLVLLLSLQFSCQMRKKNNKNVHYLGHVQHDSNSSVHFADLSWNCMQRSVVIKGNSCHTDKNLQLRRRSYIKNSLVV